MSTLPEFIHDQPEDMVQPWTVRKQGNDHVAIIQWDGAGEQRHWVLIPVKEVDDFLAAVGVATL